MIRIVHKTVAGLDVHKKTVVATRMRVTEEDRVAWETKTFGTTTPELLELHDWLLEWSPSHVAMESTADYWKPVFNILEDSFEVWLVNAQHVKHVPGRKTDAKDSEWLAELMLHGMLKPSFIPPKPQRALRELTRYRTTLVQERVRVVNRVQKLLEGANIKLASVATDITGVSARAMLAGIAAGQTDAALMADLAKGRMRNKIPELEKALTGRVQPHQRFVLAQQLDHIDYLDEKIGTISAAIAQQIEDMSRPDNPAAPDEKVDRTTSSQEPVEPWVALSYAEAVALLCTVPGIDEKRAEGILGEIGTTMRQFHTADALAAWTGLAPGNHESGGKRYSGRTTQGNRFVKSIMVQAAWSAVRAKDNRLKARYHRLVVRRGKKRAIVAVAHTMIVIIWHILAYGQPYQELGADYYDERKKESKMTYLIRQLEKLTGGSVSIELQPAAA
jgi:transposase